MFTEAYLLNLPNPPGLNVYKAFAGGFGTLGGIKGGTLIPQYLIYAASACENKGVKYNILDAQALDYRSTDIVKEVELKQPDIIIAWISLPSMDHDVKVLNDLRKSVPNTTIIGIGTVCKVIPEKILTTCKVDALLSGNYPYYNSISNLIERFNGDVESLNSVPGIIRKNKGVKFSNPIDKSNEKLDEINLEVYHKLPVEKYVSDYLDREYNKISGIPILTGVGCPYGCIYCPYPIGYGTKVVNKSTNKIIEEIEFLIKTFSITGFILREQAFTHNRKRVLDFCSEINKRSLDIRWGFETRVDLVDRELLDFMNKAGCFRIHFGVETGDEEILSRIGKPHIDKDKIKNAFDDSKEAGIFTHAHMMIGFPDDSWKSIEKSKDFLREINPDDMDVNIVTPYPGTKLYDAMLDEGVVVPEDWAMFTSYNPVLNTKNLSSDELIKAKDKLKLDFYRFKLKSDPKYRKQLLKRLPRKILNRVKVRFLNA